ncbi:MAG TPA: glycosyltransferase [Candidatus Limnocylindrales bacterium]|nr:glycosyltransferase [Candidatus Limnocylindrales bacterium]
MREATIEAQSPARLASLLPTESYEAFAEVLARAGELLQGRTLWNVNATLTGGGVAELLGSTLPYLCQAGTHCRWVMLDSNPEFLDVTKRLHNLLHGFPGDSGKLGAQEKRLYDKVTEENAAQLLGMVRSSDVVVVHDPQPAGLVPRLKELGAQVIWHCHIGTDTPNDLTRQAWSFLLDDVSVADAYIFSRAEYLWDGLDPARLHVIQPSIDPFSPKNIDLSNVEEIVWELEIPPGVPIVTQVARWDRLKDHAGMMRLFAEYLTHTEAHLVLAGPAVDGVADDPEGAATMRECATIFASFDSLVRDRIHLMSLPMDDVVANALMVNALQRHSDVVVQKSLAEGFGLVVAEAMWKRRPVVASRVGGIQDQIEHGLSGLLVDDARDGDAFAHAIEALLGDPGQASEMGERARQRVMDRFLTNRQLTETVDLLASLPG